MSHNGTPIKHIFLRLLQKSNARRFFIPRLSNDMKIVVQKNNLGGQIWG